MTKAIIEGEKMAEKRIRTTTEGMIKAIIWSVANRNIKSNSDIANDTGLDRLAVCRWTELLSGIGVLIPHYRGKKTYYTLNPDIQRYIAGEGVKFFEQILETRQ